MSIAHIRESSDAAIIAASLSQVWLANQMASSHTASVPTGFQLFDRELPGGGWPIGVLTELLLQQPGIGEIRLLLPALRHISRHRRIALVTPPHKPQLAAWDVGNLQTNRILWIKATRSADALWAAEQILRNGSCGAVLCWQPYLRKESLRRLHLAAQGSNMVFWLFRPLTAAQEASPASLRLGLRPARAGIGIEILKRRGPRRDDCLVLPLMPIATNQSLPVSTPSLSDYAPVDRCTSATAVSGEPSPVLV